MSAPAIPGRFGPRQRLLGLVGVATVLLALGLALDEPAQDTPAAAVAASPRARGAAPVRPAEAPTADRRAAWAPLAPAAARAWAGAAPVAAAASAASTATTVTRAPEPVTAPVRSAPPPPYTLIGRFEDEGRTRAWLATPQRLLEVKAGDVLDQQWRVEAIGPTQIDLTWLPGGERRSLAYPRS